MRVSNTQGAVDGSPIATIIIEAIIEVKHASATA